MRHVACFFALLVALVTSGMWMEYHGYFGRRLQSVVFFMFFSHTENPGQILNSNSHSVENSFVVSFPDGLRHSEVSGSIFPSQFFGFLKWVRRRRIEYPFPQQIWRISHDKPMYRFLEEQSLELSVPCRDLSWHVFVTGQSKINQSHF